MMNKTDIQFKKDVDSIMHNEESELTDVQKEWTTIPADAHLRKYAKYDAESAFEAFSAKVYPKTAKTRSLWIRYASMAASVVVVCTIGIGLYFNWGKQESILETVAEIPAVNDSLPRIVLANGQVINVTDDISVGGMTASLTGTTIELEENKDNGADGNEKVEMSELVIPRGRMYMVKLFDDTKVLLNSESSLRFPERFLDTRRVELTGQAYFEVTKDKRPFSVVTSNGTVTVLGTSFSVTSYSDTPFNVALNSGKVKFENEKSNVTIGAGELITCDANGVAHVSTTDLHCYTAWVDGLIFFENASLADIMTNIERMYDVRIHYMSQEKRTFNYTGECSRFNTVKEFMTLLGLTEDFDFEIKGKDIYIK